MNLLESLLLALDALRANKMRSFLTMLGVIIGVGAVIGLVSVGTGATHKVTAQVESLGSNVIMVTPSGGRGRDLRAEDAAMLADRVPGVAEAVPVTNQSALVVWMGHSTQTRVTGTNEALPAVDRSTVAAGRFLSSQDVSYRRQVAVLGSTTKEDLFGLRDAVGETVRINGYPFTVIGVLAKQGEGGLFSSNSDDRVIIPFSTAERVFGSTRIGNIYVLTAPGTSVDLTVNHIKRIFELRFNSDQAVTVYSQQQILATVSSITGTLTALLGAIAGVSLLVGGIGIMNIMLVSVTERTREIGVRKAVGAKNRQILAQFLVESTLTSVIGGLIGIALGEVGSQVMSRVGGIPSIVTWQWVLLAFGFAAAVGLFFGIYPAMRAARLDPIEALRHD